MFENVLVGVDGYHGGRDAIALARQLAEPEARITFAHVYGGHTLGGRASALAVPLELEAGEQALARALRESGVAAETELLFSDSVGRGLHELATQRHADLLVVGSTRRALLGRVLMGDDARAALNGSPCAIAVAARAYAETPHELLRIGVGYDESSESTRALAAARELAERSGAAIDALWVVALPRVQEEAPVPADWNEAIKRLEGEYAARLVEIEGVTGHATHGGPREELAQFAKGLDLLVVGSRGYGPLDRLIHGSVSGYLLAHAACSLLVLTRGGPGPS